MATIEWRARIEQEVKSDSRSSTVPALVAALNESAEVAIVEQLDLPCSEERSEPTSAVEMGHLMSGILSSCRSVAPTLRLAATFAGSPKRLQVGISGDQAKCSLLHPTDEIGIRLWTGSIQTSPETECARR
jgi:hypothetical protein